MATPRAYEAAKAEDEGAPVYFTVAGARFDCPVPLPAVVVFDFFDVPYSQTDPETGEETSNMYAIFKGSYDFLMGVVAPKDRARLKAALTKNRTDMGTIFEIAQEVVGKVSGRPTTGQESSDALPSTSGKPSSPAVASRASRRSKRHRASA